VITGKTKLLGVIGDPIEHSLSPIIHNAALAELQACSVSGANQQVLLDFAYLPFAIKPEDLSTAVEGFRAVGVRGFNVTIPHKQAIISLLSEVSDLAKTVGAVNTVWATEQGWAGTNTDVLGFLAPLKHLSNNLLPDWSQTNVVILGCGGAARAVVVACEHLGCARVHVVGREQQRLHQFQLSWLEELPGLNLEIHLWEEIEKLLPHCQLLVNTTPIGMAPSPDQSPLSADAVALLPASAIVYDLIYTPNPTQLLRLAQLRGLTSIDGLEMLIQQGGAALEIWLGQPAPISVMRQAAREWLFPSI
jgi:shikimate dehydrogenase